MRQRVTDAYYALGFGIVFLGYVAWEAWRTISRNRQTREHTRAQLIAGDALSRRDRMERGEWMGTRDD